MSATKDFRTYAFDAKRVRASGEALGRHSYWKLYAIENLFRVLIHSILNVQIAPTWWTTAVAPALQAKAQRFKSNYLKTPWHGIPGVHDIYYLGLPDLNEIIRANAHLFSPVIPEIDQLMAQVEMVRLPRNIVCHMNWPTTLDKQRIDLLHHDIAAQTEKLRAQGRVPLLIP